MAASNSNQNATTAQANPARSTPPEAARQAQTGAAAANAEGADPLPAPEAAQGTLSFDKLDKAAEWAAYAAAGRCARLIADQVLAAAGALPPPEPDPLAIPHPRSAPPAPAAPAAGKPTILLVGFPGALHCAGSEQPVRRIAAQQELYSAALTAAASTLDQLLFQTAAKQTQDAKEADAGVESSPAAAYQVQGQQLPAFDFAAAVSPMMTLIGSAIGGLPGALAGAALPNMVSGVGAVVGLAASTLAYLRSDYEVHGTAASVAASALRAAACGALAAGGLVRVKTLDVEDVENAPIIATLDAAAWTALEARRKVAALREALRLRQAALAGLEADRRALLARRWNLKPEDLQPPNPPPAPIADPPADTAQHGGGQEGAAPESAATTEGLLVRKRDAAAMPAAGETAGDSGEQPPPPSATAGGAASAAQETALLQNRITLLEKKIEEQNTLDLRCSAAVAETEVLLAAFDAWTAKVTTEANDQPSPLVRAAVREAAAAAHADYLLYISLDSVGAEAAGRSKSLFTLVTGDGALTFSGHAAVSFVLMDCTDGAIIAGDMVGASTSIRHTLSNGGFKEWGYAEFKRAMSE